MDLSQVQAQVYDVLPKGQYIARVTKAETKSSKVGGEYIQIEFTIADGKQTGRKFWDIFNTKNQNPKAVSIALGKLKSLCLASGIPETQLVNFNNSMLANRVVKVTTDVKTDSYGDKVAVKKYEPANSATTPAVNNTNSFTQSDIPF